MMAEANRKPFEPGIVARVAQGLRYMVTGAGPTDWFGPGAPPPPLAPAEVAGRQFDYPVAYNSQQRPRANETTGFAELRALADAYDVLRLVIETRKDQMEKLAWTVRPRAKDAGRTIDDPAAADPRIGAIEGFLQRPDREHDWGSWLRILLEDMLVIDAATLYRRRSRGGGLYALEPIDGATIKRVLDGRGRTPLPPEPAYQQVLKGLPAVDYSADELIYAPRNPRSHRVYGFSPVEQILATVNIALRRQATQLQFYTEGNVPEALIGVPADWAPEQIRQFQDYWDALLEGNSAARSHAKFVPGGMTYHATRGDASLKDAFDEWLARVVCYAFSVPPTPFVAQVNRATAETIHEAALAEGLAPLQNWVKRVIDRVLAEDFAAADLEFAWSDEGDRDPAEAARIAEIYVRSGIKSVNEVREELGLAPLPPGGDGAATDAGPGIASSDTVPIAAPQATVI